MVNNHGKAKDDNEVMQLCGRSELDGPDHRRRSNQGSNSKSQWTRRQNCIQQSSGHPQGDRWQRQKAPRVHLRLRDQKSVKVLASVESKWAKS